MVRALRYLALVLVVAAPAAVAPTSRQAAAAPLVEAMEAVGITVADMDRAVDFYANVLSFEPASDVEVTGEPYERLMGVFGLRMRVVRMRLGNESIDLIEVVTPRGRPIPVDSRSNDRWFQHVAIIVSDMDRAYDWLRRHKVQHASPAPQRLPDWNPNAGGIEAFYFRDPDGNHLEILRFPEGKGDPKWHRPTATDHLFLGIDHTAIVVGDTNASLAFYRDRLGLTVAGESENHGPGQERLNKLFGARLRITALRALAGGPGIELLEYLTSRDGRPMPADTRANDLWHWQVDLRAASTDRTAEVIRAGHDRLVSPGAVALPDDGLGFTHGLMARDPDGHALMFVER